MSSQLLKCLVFVWLLFVALNAQPQDDSPDDREEVQSPNILFIMLDDLGRADISKFGSEWETPSIDAFVDDSIQLTHHYIGFVCSASRSQYLTGRHSYHNGYGTLDVFDRAKLGGIPQGSPTIADYLSLYGGYTTYAIGKWQLGYSFDEQTPNYRGFDYFWGFYGGLEDYFDKTAAIMSDHSDSDDIKNDDTEYYDFWENGEYYDATGTYSTYQYLDKIMSIMDDHNSELNSDPFFIYLALQAPHMPFPDAETEFGDTCDELYADQYDEMKDRDGVCEAMLGLEYFMDSLLDYLQQDDMENLWDNTLIVFTSDNGGALSHGSCNYPLRGGKNTYFDGNQRVHAFVGGGYIPDELRGTTKTGLMANVDWMPTLMSFAGLIPSDYTQISFDNDNTGNTDVPITFDGYNMYSYIMSTDTDMTPIRDHVMFQLRPTLDDDSNYVSTINKDDIHSKVFRKDMEDIIDGLSLDEVALVFYDNTGKLWKYFDAEESTNEVGNPQVNCNWCMLNTNSNNDNVYKYSNSSDSITRGLYDLDNDISESVNLIDSNDISMDIQKTLKATVTKNILQYFNNEYSESSVYLYGNFDCFYNKHNAQAWPIYFDNLWAPFLERSEFDDKIATHCGFDTTHMMYKLHTTDFNLPSDSKFENIITDKSDIQQLRNRLAVVKPIGRDNYITRDNRELVDNDEDNDENNKEEKEEEKESEMIRIGTGQFTSAATADANARALLISVICIGAIGSFLAVYIVLKQCAAYKLQESRDGYDMIA